MKKIIMFLCMISMMLITAGCGTVGESVSYDNEVNLGESKKIKIETQKVDFKITQEDVESIQVKLNTHENGSELKVENYENKILIKTAEDDETKINVTNSGGERLIVKIPVKFKGIIEIESQSGDGEVYYLQTDEVNIQINSGDLNIKNINCDLMKAQLEKGEVKMDIQESTFKGSLKVNSGSGKITVYDDGEKRKHEGKYEETIGDEKKEIIIITDGGEVDIKK